MNKKELPCPHCGQDIHIPARYNAENIAKLEGHLADARAIMQRFVDKVDSARARSKETYAEMTEWLKEN